MKRKFGYFFVGLGILIFLKIIFEGGLILPAIFNLILWGGIGVFIFRSANRDEEENKKNIQEKLKSDEIRKFKTEIAIEDKIKKAENLKIQLSQIKEIHILEISNYKKVIIDNEKNIIEKGGDNQLFSFLKIDSFLNDFRARIVKDQSELSDILDMHWLKERIKEEMHRDDLDKIIENLKDMTAKLEGEKTTGFDANLDKLFELGNLMKPSMENQIKTMEYYSNMAVAMIVFYLNDNKIRYFEIYEAFDKIGVFDSSWQKNVLNKLDNIEIRLSQINNKLTELNQNFISLIDSSENIVSELKGINNSIMTNNMLQTITAYQTWRINKNLKSLRD